MRPSIHLVLWTLTALTWQVRAAAAEASPRQIALGLSVLDPGLSLWHIEEKTMFGMELYGLQWSGGKDRDYRFDGALTLKRILSQGPLFKFGHLSAYHTSRLDWWEEHSYSGGSGVEIGGGVLFQPWKKVRLMLRQGIALERSEDHYSGSGGYDTLVWVEETWTLRLLLLVCF
ncbi:MAG: hypothetical protein OXI35_00100 [Gemmatimonadota bacterium]|nr:hypothetical protein [Gemmatimonadota bacterium]